MELLHEEIDFSNVQIDPAPFQLVEQTSLYKVSFIEVWFVFLHLQNVKKFSTENLTEKEEHLCSQLRLDLAIIKIPSN